MGCYRFSDADRVRAAKQRRADMQPTADDWAEIGRKKNSDADKRKLAEVKAAMDAGELTRDPADAYAKNGRLKPFSKSEALRLYPRLVEQQREATMREMVANTPANYHLITTETQFADMLRDLYNEPIFAIDTETTGLDVYTDHIVGVSLTLPKAGYHVYIPVAHDEGRQLDRDYVLGGLRPFLVDEERGKVLHNAKYDMHMLMRYDIEMGGLKHDTQVAQHVLNENEPSFALKNLATKYLGEPSDTFDVLFGKDAKFNTLPLDISLAYAAKDTDLTWRLYEFQRKHFKRLPELGEYYDKVENPSIAVAFEMERTGFVYDEQRTKELSKKLHAELDEIMADLKREFGDINFNSPAQLSEKFFDELKLDKHLPTRWKKSTDVKTLKILAKYHDGIGLLLKYRDKNKLLTTYVDAMPKLIAPDGCIHGQYNQAGTVTGRFSSNNPNLQNFSKDARKMFVAPKGKVLLSGDFSSQEPRLLAHFSQEPSMIESFNNGEDVYAKEAARMFKKPIEECGDGSTYRKKMKIGFLATMYGTSPPTLAEQLGVSRKEAEEFLDEFMASLPKVAEWIEGNKRFARKYGYVTMLYGRKRRLPDAKSRDKWTRLRAERQATNARIQGSAAIQTKLTMVALQRLCREKDWQMAWTCHDEVGLYVPETISYGDVKEFERVMTESVPLSVPNKSDVELSRRWGEGYTVDEWFAKQNESEAV